MMAAVHRSGPDPTATGTAVAMSPGDRLLCAVMVLDTVTSAAMVVITLATTPVLVLAGAPPGLLWAVGVVLVVLAVALAAMGAVTAGILMRSPARGNVELPDGLWLPLPKALQILPPRSGHEALVPRPNPSPPDVRPTGGGEAPLASCISRSPGVREEDV